MKKRPWPCRFGLHRWLHYGHMSALSRNGWDFCVRCGGWKKT